jgi:hypothetical protein
LQFSDRKNIKNVTGTLNARKTSNNINWQLSLSQLWTILANLHKDKQLCGNFSEVLVIQET